MQIKIVNYFVLNSLISLGFFTPSFKKEDKHAKNEAGNPKFKRLIIDLLKNICCCKI